MSPTKQVNHRLESWLGTLFNIIITQKNLGVDTSNRAGTTETQHSELSPKRRRREELNKEKKKKYREEKTGNRGQLLCSLKFNAPRLKFPIPTSHFSLFYHLKFNDPFPFIIIHYISWLHKAYASEFLWSLHSGPRTCWIWTCWILPNNLRFLGHSRVEVGGRFQPKNLSFLQLFLDFDSWVLGIGDEFVLKLSNFGLT